MSDKDDYGKSTDCCVNQRRAMVYTRYTTTQVIRVPNANEVEVGVGSSEFYQLRRAGGGLFYVCKWYVIHTPSAIPERFLSVLAVVTVDRSF